MKIAIKPLEETGTYGGVSKLRIATYPGFPEVRDTEFYDSFYRWYQKHPLANELYRWVALTEKGETVGHVAALPQYYRIDGKRVVAHTPGDYMVLPGYGFQAVMLMRRFFRETENCVACDMVPAVIEVETRLGAQVAGEMQYAAKLLNVSRLPIPALPGPLRRLLKVPAKLTPARGYESRSGPVRSQAHQFEDETGEIPLLTRPRAPIPAPIKAVLNQTLETVDNVLSRGYGDKLEVEELESFDESFDEFFEKIAAVIPCIPEKDSTFLNWRHGPGSPQGPVKILAVRSGQGLLGYAVLKIASTAVDGYILDLTTLPGYRDATRALLREAVRYFRWEGIHIIRYRFLESPTSPQAEDLKRLGFFYRKGRGNNLLVKFEDGVLNKLSRDLSNWSYNIGDGEATFWLR